MRALLDIVEDLSPPLGAHGGPCAVIHRIRQEVPDSAQQALIDPIEDGLDLSNTEASKIYDLETEALAVGWPFKRLVITAHAQYRMDLRGVTVDQIRAAFVAFQKEWLKYKDQKSPVFDTWMMAARRRESVYWTDLKQKLVLVFVIRPDEREFVLVTTYWRDQARVKPPGDGGCDI